MRSPSLIDRFRSSCRAAYRLVRAAARTRAALSGALFLLLGLPGLAGERGAHAADLPLPPAISPRAAGMPGSSAGTTEAAPAPDDTFSTMLEAATSVACTAPADAAGPSGPPLAADGAPEAVPPELVTVVTAVAPPAPAPPPVPMPPLGFDAALGIPKNRYGKLIYQTSSRYALNPFLVAAIMKAESDFNPRARSRKGALGLMQMLPSTARRFGLQRRKDLFNPKKNIEAAGRYLRWLVNRFGEDPLRVLAAYNAGEGAVERFGGVPPFAETRDYVQRIFADLGFTAVLLDAPTTVAGIAAVTDAYGVVVGTQ
jgi:soluble lytic murein transglycosylase-like protein